MPGSISSHRVYQFRSECCLEVIPCVYGDGGPQSNGYRAHIYPRVTGTWSSPQTSVHCLTCCTAASLRRGPNVALSSPQSAAIECFLARLGKSLHPPNSRGHATKRGLRVPNPNSRGHATKRGLRVPNPNSRGHTTPPITVVSCTAYILYEGGIAAGQSAWSWVICVSSIGCEKAVCGRVLRHIPSTASLCAVSFPSNPACPGT